MAITNRNLPNGTRLIAKHKGLTHTCIVRDSSDGKRYELGHDGIWYKSLSAAGSALMGGIACNGWRFWSVDGDEPSSSFATTTEERKEEPKPKRAPSIIKRTPNQQGLASFQTRWFCSACMKSFTARTEDGEPEECPAGHKAHDPELTTID